MTIAQHDTDARLTIMTKYSIALYIAMAVTPAWTQQPQAPKQTPEIAKQNRDQLVPASVGQGNDANRMLFLIDTQTGKVWQYQDSFTSQDENGKKVVTPPSWVGIQFLMPAQAAPKD